MAAVLACGNGAVLSHRSAAALWQLRPDGWKTDVTVATDRRSRGFMRTHRTGLDPADITECDGIPVTTAARTLLDLASILDRDQLVKTIEESERRGLFDLQAVDAVLARAGHRPGTVALRSVLADYQDPADTRSGLERDFAALLRRSNVPTPQSNVVVEGYTVDCLWPGSRFIVELDSRGFHLTPRMFESDRLRDAKLMRAGYRVLRVTAKRLHDDPTGVLEDLTDLAA